MIGLGSDKKLMVLHFSWIIEPFYVCAGLPDQLLVISVSSDECKVTTSAKHCGKNRKKSCIVVPCPLSCSPIYPIYICIIYVSLITLGAKRGYLFETRSRAASWASPSIRNLHQGQDGQSQNSTQYQDKKGQKAAHFNYCLPFSNNQALLKSLKQG